eukprot:COSAG02_NODE_10318_length_1970_cov_1.571352_1_plen_347_part_00
MLALEAFHASHADVSMAINVTRHPFSFLGQMPPEEDSGHAERWGGWPRLRRQGKWHERLMDYSGSAAGRDQFEAQVSKLGEAAGIEFDFNVHLNRQPIESQRLLLWAARFGKGEEFIAALSDRHFQQGSQGECATCRPTLLAAAAEAGLDVAVAEAFLDSNELFEEVWAKYGEMPALGIRAIPLFCFSVPQAGLLSGPFRSASNELEAGAVMSGSGNQRQFLELFEQIYRLVEQRQGMSMVTPPPSTAAGETPGESNGESTSATQWVGQRVRLVGLVASPHLNGATGRCVNYDAKKGRYAIQLDRQTQNGRPVAVKPTNLELFHDEDDGERVPSEGVTERSGHGEL